MVNSPMLTANLYVEDNYFGYCTIISNQQQMGFLHKHNYYEVFLVIDGSATHYVNGEYFPIQKGSLVLLRPEDAHCYLKPISEDYRFINFILTQELLQSILTFLGPGFAVITATDRSFPLSRTLSEPDFERITKILEHLMIYPRTDIEDFNTTFKFAALEVLNCFYWRSIQYDDANWPVWLRQLIEEMRKKKNYIRGLPAMYENSHYSPEHLCRIFQKYLKISPTTFLANIRLEEAARQLIYTDAKIIDIANNVGFDNLSYFYRRFKAWYGLSPQKYRKVSKTTPVYAIKS